MKFPISPEVMTTNLEKLYDATISNVPVLGSAVDLANSYRQPGKSLHASVDSLIRLQCFKTGTAGFMLGVPGGFFSFATIPADLTNTLFIQLRMVAAIAHLYGYDIHTDQARSMALLCLCGKGAQEICQKSGVKLTEIIMKKAINKIPGVVIKAINQAVGFKLVTKFGQKGVINLGRMLPFAGGLFGAGFNLLSTRTIGYTAKRLLSNA